MIGYAGYDIFRRRTSESTSGQFRAVDWQAVSRCVSRHVSRHVGHFSSLVCGLVVVGLLEGVVVLFVSWFVVPGETLTSSSRDTGSDMELQNRSW